MPSLCQSRTWYVQRTAATATLPRTASTRQYPLTSLDTFLQIKRPDHTVLHVSFNEIEALLVVDACERALFDEIVAMHTPHGLGLNNLNVEAQANPPLASSEAIPKLAPPCLDSVIASPATWCLFAVDYSHFSNVTARQLTQLLRQATIPFVYSAGHNMEYIWVMTPNLPFTSLLVYLPQYLHRSLKHLLLTSSTF